MAASKKRGCPAGSVKRVPRIQVFAGPLTRRQHRLDQNDVLAGSQFSGRSPSSVSPVVLAAE